MTGKTKCRKLKSCRLICVHSEMDITRDFGSRILGSNPGGRAILNLNRKLRINGVFCFLGGCLYDAENVEICLFVVKYPAFVVKLFIFVVKKQ